MEEKLVTLAIHSYDKAIILKSLLESEGIESYIHNVNILIPQSSEGVRVRIKESDLPKALAVVEASAFNSTEIPPEEQKKRGCVLIPVDFSTHSLKACKLGFYAAKELDTEAVIVHIYYIPYTPIALSINDVTPIVTPESIELDHSNARKAAQEEMDLFMRSVKALQMNGEIPEVEYSTLIREGIPEESIIDLGDELDPVLIVMGTRGEAKREFSMLGSVTAEVIEQSRQKILAVPEDAPYSLLQNVKNIAFATNFDERALSAFDDLMELMKGREIGYTIVHFDEKKNNPKDEARLKQMADYLASKYPGISIKYRLVTAYDIMKGLNEFMEERSIDLLSITTHKRNPFSRLLYLSFASKMLFLSKIPILVVRA